MTATMQIPGYKIMRELGHGGMAFVYLAIQESFGREVALKVLSPRLADEDQFSKRFLREARIVSQLNHPNIVTVYDAGKHGQHHYMSMEYIPGKDLKQLKDAISRKDALRIVKDVARALDFAGDKGFVHRDVKPENIMIHETDHRVILMDFGIAHGDDITQGMTQTGKAIGTPHFMSPEQTKGLKVDHRSDIYSLGVVLFQLLAGHLPYDADSAVAVGIKHLTAPIPLLPAGLEMFQAIVNNCLSKHPEHRYQKASELIAALDKISDTQLNSISLKATAFKQAGADHNAETQVSGANVSARRKIPDIVFPATKKTVLVESNDNKSSATRRRNLLIILLLATMAWAANEKQQELTQFWAYQALPEITEVFPDLFPKSYMKFWADKAELEKTKATKITAAKISLPAKIQPQATETVDVTAAATTALTEPQSVTPKEITLPRKDRVTELKESLEKTPENAIELAAIYKKRLSQTPDNPAAHKELKELREWSVKQVQLAIATGNATLARQYIEIIKQNFPRAANNKHFIRMENKVAFLERLNTHFVKAEKYFSTGALSKPARQNALSEINTILKLAPNNEDAKNFLKKIVNSYLEKTIQLQQQGNLQNAILMVEEGVAALNNPLLISKRNELKNIAQHHKIIESLFKQAIKYQAAGNLISPQAYNAYDIYQEILKQDNNNLQAKAAIKTMQQQLANDIIAMINKGSLDEAKTYLQETTDRYGRTSLLASVQLRLNDALDNIAAKIEILKLSASPLTSLITASQDKTTDKLHLRNTLYVGFNFINFDPGSTWLEANLSSQAGKVVQKPVVISRQSGEHFFEISIPDRGFTDENYKLELKLKNKILISKSFSVDAR